MTFKKEISIDGVATLVCAVGIITFLARIQFTQEFQSKVIEQHSIKLEAISDIKTAIVKIEARNQITDEQSIRIQDFEARLRALEKTKYGR